MATPLIIITAILLTRSSTLSAFQLVIPALYLLSIIINVKMWTKMKYEVYPEMLMARTGGKLDRYPWAKIKRIWLEEPPAAAIQVGESSLSMLNHGIVVAETTGWFGRPKFVRMRTSDSAGLFAAIQHAAPQLPLERPTATPKQ